MNKFTIDELKKAAFPVPAFEVSLSTSTGEKDLKCNIHPVIITGVQLRDVVTFIDKDGVSSYGNPIMFFRTSEDAQLHINQVYGTSKTVADKAVKSITMSHFLVTGRVVGDDEDSAYTFEVGNIVEAREAFHTKIVCQRGEQEEIVINSVAVSDTPINIVEQVRPS